MYFKLLELLILKVMFNKDEYNFKSKSFNPIKVVTTLILIANLGFTIYLFNKLFTIYIIMEKQCPGAFIKKQ